jgi:transcriptional regulator with XRE-family HTH domain
MCLHRAPDDVGEQPSDMQGAAFHVSADILLLGPMDASPNRIRELRLAAGMTQQSLCDAIGVGKMTISDLERGVMALTQDYMRRLSTALGVLPADLLPLDENPAALSVEERRLLGRLRTASMTQREQIWQMLDVLLPMTENAGSFA